MLETCEIEPFADRCTVGAPNDASHVQFSELGSEELRVGVECVSVNPECGNGFSLHQAWAVIYASTVTISDPSAPSVINPAGTLWTTEGFHRGTEMASFSAADNVGIKRTRVVVDGVPLAQASTSWACDYTYPVPCQDRAASYSVDTNGIPDGVHTLALSAVDAADNEQTVTRSVTVDNTSPAAPRDLGVVGGEGWREATSFAVSWANPTGQVAPIVAANYELCGVTGCTTSRVVGPDIHSLGDIRVPTQGDHTLAVWLEDGAGNVSSANRSAVVHLRAGKDPSVGAPPPAGGSPTTPTPPSTPRASAKIKLARARISGSRLLVSGSLRKAATGTVSLTYRVRASGRTITYRRKTRVRRGSFRATIRLSRAARRARRGTLVVKYAGDSRYRATTSRRTVTRR